LTILLARPGKLVSREELQNALWQGNSFGDFEKGLNAAVNRLRENLEDSATNPKYIETVPGRGYRFIGDLASGSDSGHALSHDKRWWAARLALLIGLPLAALVLAIMWWQWPGPAPAVRNYKQITYDGQRKGPHVTDGRRVYFMAKTPSGYSIAQVSTQGGAATLLQSSAGSDLRLLDLSPDGSELLVLPSSDEERDEQLYGVTLPDGAPRRIGDLTASDATWSPDGQRIVYVHGQSLFSANRVGADVHKLVELPDQPYQPRISPDGLLIRFALPGGPSLSQLWDINTDGTGLHQVLPNWNHVQAEGNWTRDGRYFLFESYVNGSEGIWSLPRRATLLSPHPKPVLLTPGNSNVGVPVVSPDGKTLFVGVGVTRMEVMRFNPDSGRFLPYLPISGSKFNFTRDGQHVIYMRLPGFDLIRSRIDGSEQVKLLQGSSLRFVQGGRLSPDEKQIAVAEEGQGNNVGIYLLPAEGGKPELLLGGRYLDPDWSPDGHFLITRGPSSLSVIDLRTKRVNPVPESAGISFPRWSPDGRYLAGVRASDEAIMLFDFEKPLWRKASEGRSGWSTWSPDGKYLYFISAQGTANTPISEQSLYRIVMNSAKQELVTNLRELRHDSVGHFISWIGFAPDGSILALRDNTTVDIFSLDWISP
jgi:Tol biopolymer transport system component